MAGKEVGVGQDLAGRNSHLLLNLNFFFFSRLLDFGLKSASQCQTLFSPLLNIYNSVFKWLFFFNQVFFFPFFPWNRNYGWSSNSSSWWLMRFGWTSFKCLLDLDVMFTCSINIELLKMNTRSDSAKIFNDIKFVEMGYRHKCLFWWHIFSKVCSWKQVCIFSA